MKLAAIYNIWDGEEHLPESVATVAPHVDVLIGMVQSISNFGEKYDGGVKAAQKIEGMNIFQYDPVLSKSGSWNELQKRNLGVIAAKNFFSCTHYLHLDCDEMHPNFLQAKNYFMMNEMKNSVMRMYTYFKSKHLRFERPDDYYVPFISEIGLKQATFNAFSNTPYRVDPTRGNYVRPVGLVPHFMHHYSWIRDDIRRKIRNSSAKRNIDEEKMVTLYQNAKSGDYIEPVFGQKLIKV